MSDVKIIKGENWIPNSYILHDEKEAIVIDPGCSYNTLIDSLKYFKLLAVLATHGHYDHIIHVSSLKNEYKVPFYLHPDDAMLVKHANMYIKLFNGDKFIEIPKIEYFVEDSEELDFGFIKVSVIHTPGHTEGSVCFRVDNNLFSGDLLFKNNIGRTDLPGGNTAKIKDSLKKINSSFSDIHLLPGHKDTTTLNEERKFNKKFIDIISS